VKPLAQVMRLRRFDRSESGLRWRFDWYRRERNKERLGYDPAEQLEAQVSASISIGQLSSDATHCIVGIRPDVLRDVFDEHDSQDWLLYAGSYSRLREEQRDADAEMYQGIQSKESICKRVASLRERHRRRRDAGMDCDWMKWQGPR